MDKEEKCFPKYQFSFFTNSKDQVVVRANNSEEFKNAVAKVKSMFATEIEEKPQQQPLQTQETANTNAPDWCTIHSTKMYGKEWNGTMLYSHTIKDVGFCNSKRIKPFAK